jgi:predicted SAM-dependent methyltransferase
MSLPRVRRKLRQFETPYKVHVGCGAVRFEGWVHLDAAYWGGKFDPSLIVWDVRDGLPFPDGSCQFIYSEHLVEHLPVETAELYFRECYRVLIPGGVVRTAMPDLEECVQHYCTKQWSQQPWLGKYGYSHIRTGAEYLNICMRDWEHRWLYDAEELNRRLIDVGFSAIASCMRGESTSSGLRERETRIESTLIAEATKA